MEGCAICEQIGNIKHELQSKSEVLSYFSFELSGCNNFDTVYSKIVKIEI